MLHTTEQQSFLVIFRLFRIFRLLKTNKRFRVFVLTAFSVLSSFMILAMIQWCVIYFFAIIGMELFYDRVTEESCIAMRTKFAHPDPNEPLPLTDWNYIVTAKYYLNNMNTFTERSLSFLS